MDLHPDRNPEHDTTTEFQAIQTAYSVLSDEGARRRYDADSCAPPTSTQSGTAREERFDPIVCSKCNAVSAQPRYKVFYTVYSFVLGAIKRPCHGVFCSKCEVKQALKSSAITLLAGWWSIPGFFLTIQTLLQNLVGGRFHEQNARIQGYQAMYFAQTGRLDLARALAVAALEIARKANVANAKKMAFKKRLGYEVEGPLKTLTETLEHFINSFPENSRRVRLKNANKVINRRFAYQLALFTAVAAAVSGAIYRQDLEAAGRERTRLEQERMERVAAAARSAKEAEFLRSHELPLPPGGLYRVVDSKEYNPKTNPPLKVTNAPGANRLMKLVRESDGAEVLSIFVRAGQTVEVAVPVGRYKARIASGQAWYGDSIRFGPTTRYFMLDRVLSFSISGDQLVGNEVILRPVMDGNLREVPITASAF